MADEIAVGIALTTDPEKTRGQLDAFCTALSKAVGMPVTAHGMWHYHHLLEALSAREVDLVWLPPILALRATAQKLCLPIALPVRHGVSTYSTALFTRPDSKIRGLDDLVGLRAAWVDRQSAAGYLIVRALLRSKGIDLEKAFSHEKFLGTHDAVADAVLDNEVDVGATFVYLDPDASTGAPKTAGWGKRQVRMITFAGPIPSDIVAANRSMDDERRAVIQTALVGKDHPELLQAGRALLGAESFVAPDEEHLSALLEVLDNLEERTAGGHTVFPPPRRS
jgi:phosphate/phosphite/phosphonate ABC transporter binding protein